MPILIDGYNLAYEMGWLTRGHQGGGALERARQRLLSFVVHSLDEKTAAATTVVFDASRLPEGVAAEQHYGPVKVLYAEGYEDADALIEELIAASGAPKQLTVVSSDRRLQTAAKRRKAQAVTGEAWHAQVLANRAKDVSAGTSDRDLAKKRDGSIPQDETDYWVEEFSETDRPDE